MIRYGSESSRSTLSCRKMTNITRDLWDGLNKGILPSRDHSTVRLVPVSHSEGLFKTVTTKLVSMLESRSLALMQRSCPVRWSTKLDHVKVSASEMSSGFLDISS